MNNRSFYKRPGVWVPALIYVLVCVVLWFLPLLQILHAESSAVIACCAFFTAGLTALHRFRQKTSGWPRPIQQRSPFGQMLLLQLAMLLVPWFMLTLSMLWQENCSYGQGFLFYLLFTIPTVCFAVALAYLIAQSGIRRKVWCFVLSGLAVALGGVVIDIGFHPQFFTYSHVFGGVLGPIYDEELFIRMGLLSAKVRTLLLAAACWMAGEVLRTRQAGRFVVSGSALLLVIALSFVFAAQLRINTPAWFIRAHLQGHAATAHFDIYYSPAVTDSTALAHLVAEHEYRYHFIQQQLGIDVADRIQSYIYPDPETKDWLTGARNTSVAPVWLADPQMHIAADAFDAVFAHELGHVFSREFGLPVINASWSVGLVEGLAVALEPADGRPTPHEQVITAVALSTTPGDSIDVAGVIGLASRLSPFGFWTGRGTVSYTTMGSFVSYLAATYGYDKVMAVYARSNFEEVFGVSLDNLVAGWAASLQELPHVDRATHAYVTRRFSIPSLFEKTCPHHVPAHEQRYRAGGEALVAGDTLAALAAFESAMTMLPGFEAATQAWASLKTNRQEPEVVIERIEADFREATPARPMSAGLWVQYGDALALDGDVTRAQAAFDSARVRLPVYARQQRGLVTLRRLLAPNADIQRVNRSLRSPYQKVEALDTLVSETPEVTLLQGLILLTESPTAAMSYLQAYAQHEKGIPSSEIQRLVEMLAVQLHYITGDHARAASEADALANTLRQEGAFNTALVYTDFARKMRYIIEHKEQGFVLNQGLSVSHPMHQRQR